MSEELTYYVWGDTHFGFEQRAADEDIRYRTVQQMARLEGYPYPLDVGGTVGKASFVLHCGDVADGTEFEYGLYEHCMGQIDIPHYDTLGNHDLGEPAETHFLERHGKHWFSFDCKGVHFVSLFRPKGIFDTTCNDEIDAVSDEQLTWLVDDLAALDPGTPVVAWCHCKPENCPNADELDAALARGNVILIFVGHLHQQPQFGPHRYDWNGRYCYLIGHCRNHEIDPVFARTFVVARMRGPEYELVQWRWDLQAWSDYQ